MSFFLKQSTATTIILGPFVDPVDGATLETSLTVTSIDVDIYKGATKSDLTITASGGDNDMAHVANGYYSLELTTGNTDTLGRLLVTAYISAALSVWHSFTVLPANIYDSLVGGTDYLQVDAAQWLGQTIAAVDTNGYPKVTIKDGTGTGEIDTTSGRVIANVTYWNGTAVGASDTAGYPKVTIKDGTGAGEIDLTAGAVATNISQIGGSAAAATNAGRAFQGIVLGTAVTGTLTTTVFTTSLTEATNDHYNGRTLTFTSGALAGQMTTITDYNGTSKAVTVTALTEAPANADEFFIA